MNQYNMYLWQIDSWLNLGWAKLTESVETIYKSLVSLLGISVYHCIYVTITTTSLIETYAVSQAREHVCQAAVFAELLRVGPTTSIRATSLVNVFIPVCHAIDGLFTENIAQWQNRPMDMRKLYPNQLNLFSASSVE